MQALLDYLRAILDWFVSLVTRGFEALWGMLKDLLCWALDGLMGAGIILLNSFNDQLPTTSFSSAWGQLPSEILGMASALGFGYALSIIIGALVIRFLLQMIPFVRWGS